MHFAREMQTILKVYREFDHPGQVTGRDVTGRIGLAMGEVFAGVLGTLQPRYHLLGQPMRNAEKLEASCDMGGINVSQEVLESLMTRVVPIGTRASDPPSDPSHFRPPPSDPPGGASAHAAEPRPRDFAARPLSAPGFEGARSSDDSVNASEGFEQRFSRNSSGLASDEGAEDAAPERRRGVEFVQESSGVPPTKHATGGGFSPTRHYATLVATLWASPAVRMLTGQRQSLRPSGPAAPVQPHVDTIPRKGVRSLQPWEKRPLQVSADLVWDGTRQRENGSSGHVTLEPFPEGIPINRVGEESADRARRASSDLVMEEGGASASQRTGPLLVL